MPASCAEFQDAFAAALDGDLPPEESRALAGHLRGCPECREAVRDAALVHRRLLEAGVEGLLPTQKSARKPAPRRAPPAWPAWPAWSKGLAAGAILAAGLFLGARYWGRQEPPVQQEAAGAPPGSPGGPGIARIAKTSPSAWLLRAKEKLPVTEAQALYARDGLEVPAGQSVVAEYADGTRVELGTVPPVLPRTTAAAGPARAYFGERQGTAAGSPRPEGKRVFLDAGALRASVAAQPADRPMTFVTPHAEAAVLGTRLHLAVQPSATRLEVTQGRVRMQPQGGRKAVEVAAWQGVTASSSVEPAVEPLDLAHEFQNGVAPTAEYAGSRGTYISELAPLPGAVDPGTLVADGDFPPGSGKEALSLLAWDLSAIPAGSQVLSAALTVHVTNPTDGGAYELYPLKRPWREAEVSWKEYAARKPWQAAGARGAEDRGPVVGSFRPVEPLGKSVVLLNEAGRALVQAWVNAPACNQGLLIAGPKIGDGLGLASPTAPNPRDRPKLAVTCVPAAAQGGAW